MLLALPFVFVPFVIGFPAGLLVYWITTNLWTVGQQYLVRRSIGPMQPPAPARGRRRTASRRARGAKRRRRRRRQHAVKRRAEPRRGRGGRAAETARGQPAAAAARRARRRSARGGGADGRHGRGRGACASCSSSSSTRWARRRGRGRRGRRDRYAARSRARTSACSSAATARRSTPSSTWPCGSSAAAPPASARRGRVDAEGYRERRAEALQRQADDAADEAVRFGAPGRARRDERDASASWSTSTCATAATSRRTARATSRDRHLVVAPLRSDVERFTWNASGRLTSRVDVTAGRSRARCSTCSRRGDARTAPTTALARPSATARRSTCHVADSPRRRSSSPAVRAARRIADLGAGAGLSRPRPRRGAAATRACRWSRAAARKCACLQRGGRGDGARATPRSCRARAEAWPEGIGGARRRHGARARRR